MLGELLDIKAGGAAAEHDALGPHFNGQIANATVRAVLHTTLDLDLKGKRMRLTHDSTRLHLSEF